MSAGYKFPLFLFVCESLYLSVYFTGYRILHWNVFSFTPFNPLNISLFLIFFNCFWWELHCNSYIHRWSDFSTIDLFLDFFLYFWFSVDYKMCMYFLFYELLRTTLKHVIILESSCPLLLQILLLSSPFSFWHFNYVYKTPFDVVQRFWIVCFDFFQFFLLLVSGFSMDLTSRLLILSSALSSLLMTRSMVFSFLFYYFDF